MSAILIDKNGIEYKNIPLDQFDYYDDSVMLMQLPRYSKRIGSLLITFGELEHLLDCAICFILMECSDDSGIRITMDMSFRQKVEVYKRFCKLHLSLNDQKDNINRFEQVIGEVISAGEIRNLIAHAKWMSLDQDGFVRTKSGLGVDAFVEFKYYKLTPRVIYNLERRISKTENNFFLFLEDACLI